MLSGREGVWALWYWKEILRGFILNQTSSLYLINLLIEILWLKSVRVRNYIFRRHKFSNAVNNSIININVWFISNLLPLNIEKTQFLQFLMKNIKLTDLPISRETKHITKVQKVKFLGLTIDNYLSCNFHIEQIKTKLNKTCFTIRSLRPYLLYEVVRMIYFSYFHSSVSCDIIFWGDSSQNNSIFKIQ
jgi:hypothetical protein